MTKVKICGITRVEDAELAVELGAWALGFILWQRSPRACDPPVAAGIARAVRRRVNTVGVFVNPTLDEVTHAAEQIGLTHLQLHGDEGPAFCSEVARRTGAEVIKAVGVSSAADLQVLRRFRSVDYHLLDTKGGPLPGGTGTAWDWGLAAEHRSGVKLILSGGLTAENVASGVEAVRPFGVDVASGVEASPGVKDPAKLEAFFVAAGGREPAPVE